MPSEKEGKEHAEVEVCGDGGGKHDDKRDRNCEEIIRLCFNPY